MSIQNTGAASLQSNDYSLYASQLNAKYSKVSIDYTSPEGSKISLDVEDLEINASETVVSKNGDGDAYLSVNGGAKNQDNLTPGINQMLWDYKEALIKSFVESHGGVYQKLSPDQLVDKNGNQVGLDEYWNADNTSQRIVDFALSFAAAQSGNPEFLDQIKAAIKKGFEEALGSLGKLPDSVQALVDDTYDQAMKKLDAWDQARNQETTAMASAMAA